MTRESFDIDYYLYDDPVYFEVPDLVIDAKSTSSGF